MEFSFNVPFDKAESPPMVRDPVTKKWYMPMVPVYSAEQYAALGDEIETVLGDDFISFDVIDQPADQVVRIVYQGHMDGDVEVRREAELDPVINAWIAAQMGG